MIAASLFEFALRSFAVGGIAWIIVALAPLSRGWRSLIHVAALGALAFVVLGWWAPLPRVPLWHASAPSSTLHLASSSLTRGLAMIWLSGFLFVMAREIAGAIRLRGILRRSQPAQDAAWDELLRAAQRTLGHDLRVELRISDELSPCATGWLRPRILLPSDSVQWPPAMRAQVLLHELAHIHRGDLWMQLAARFIAACHWFNPFVHGLLRRLEMEREFACDEMVVHHHGSATDYAECLLAIATRVHRDTAVPSLALLPRGSGRLETRIAALFAEASACSRGRRAWEAGACVVALVLLAACSLSGPAQPADDEKWTASEVARRFAADPFPGER